ncbi:RNA polymerase sigma factor [Ilumatobacter sp.]|uniref:RNA polymerase sigma factor n=1 Tax=Ilumatobacter sp. TaxID=1967498 RepID=UPI003C67C819
MTRGCPDDRTDVELVAAVVERDRAALHELYARHQPWLSIRLAYRCSDRTMVEEAVQDTFVAIWSSAHKYRATGPVAAWIWGIGIRRLLHVMRPRKSLRERLLAQRSPDLLSAEDELLVGVEHGDVGMALGRLSPELRMVVQATVLDGLSCQEAGRLLGIPTGTVKTRMMRAKREMREALI